MEFIIFLLLASVFPIPALIIGFIYFCWLFKVKKPSSFIIPIIVGAIGLTIIFNLVKVAPFSQVQEVLVEYRFTILFTLCFALFIYLLFFRFKKQTYNFLSMDNKITRLKLIFCLTSIKNEAIKKFVDAKVIQKEGFDRLTFKVFLNHFEADNLWDNIAKSICLLNIKEILNAEYDELVKCYNELSNTALEYKLHDICINPLNLLLTKDYDLLYRSLDFLSHDEKISIYKTFDDFQHNEIAPQLLKKAFFDRFSVAADNNNFQ